MKAALRALACPACRAGLTMTEPTIVCAGCQATYDVVRGIPIMLPASHSVVLESPPRPAYVQWLKRKLARVPHPSPKYSTATGPNMTRLREMLADGSSVLIVGAGVDHGGDRIEKLGTLLDTTVNLDVAPGSHTDVVGDAHHLPFPEGNFDLVLSQGVLEHTFDSDRAAAEMFRVLKPGGLVYAEAPFLAPGHMEHTDFRRFTLQGLETLFGRFERVDSGVNGAGISALLWLFITTASATLSFRNDAIYWFLRMGLTLVLSPLKYLDVLVCRLPQAKLIAAGNFYLGRKPAGHG